MKEYHGINETYDQTCIKRLPARGAPTTNPSVSNVQQTSLVHSYLDIRAAKRMNQFFTNIGDSMTFFF